MKLRLQVKKECEFAHYHKRRNARLRSLTLVLGVIILFAGCGKHERGSFLTIPQHLTEMQTLNNGYLENFQIPHQGVASYLDKRGNVDILLYTAPPERNSGLHAEGEAFLSVGSFTTKRLPTLWSATDSIRIFDEARWLEISPTEDGGHYAQSLQENVNAFGEPLQVVSGTDALDGAYDIRWTVTLFGVTAEIVIPEPIQELSYRLQIRTEPLIADFTCKDYILFRESNQSPHSLIYTPLVVDANQTFSRESSASVVATSPDSVHIVEFLIDNEFLNSKQTKYPLTITQSFFLYVPSQVDNEIGQKTAYSRYLSPYLELGNTSEDGLKNVLVRMERLEELDLNPDKIISAYYVFRNLYDLEINASVKAHPITQPWCSITTTWAKRPEYEVASVAGVTVKSRGEYQLDITDLVRDMLENRGKEDATLTIENGFLLECSDEVRMLLASGDNGNFSPCLVIKLQP